MSDKGHMSGKDPWPATTSNFFEKYNLLLHEHGLLKARVVELEQAAKVAEVSLTEDQLAHMMARVQCFIYIMMRDHLSFGTMTQMIREHVDGDNVKYTSAGEGLAAGVIALELLTGASDCPEVKTKQSKFDSILRDIALNYTNTIGGKSLTTAFAMEVKP